MSDIRILQNGARVLLVINGRQVEGMPWQTALQVAEALRRVGKLAEEWAQADRIADDQALLMRAGAPIGLTQQQGIRAEAEKRALHDRDLRRYLPTTPLSGIDSREHFGVPKLSQTDPRETR